MVSESRSVGAEWLTGGLLLLVVLAAGIGGAIHFWIPVQPAAAPASAPRLPMATGARLNQLKRQAKAVIDENADYLRKSYPYGFAIAIRDATNDDLYFFESEYGTPVKVQPLPNLTEGLLEHEGLSHAYVIRFDLLRVSVADSLGSDEEFNSASLPLLRIPTFPSFTPTPTGYSQVDNSGAELDLAVELISQDEVILVIGFRKREDADAKLLPGGR